MMRDRAFWEPTQVQAVGRPRYDIVQQQISMKPLAIVQQKGTTDETGGSSSTSVAFSSNVTVGNVIVVSIASGSLASAQNVSGVNDGLSNTYTRQIRGGQNGSAPSYWAEVWTAPVTTGGADTVNINFSAVGEWVIQCYEVQGLVSGTAGSSGQAALVCASGGVVSRAGAIVFTAMSVTYVAGGTEANPAYSGTLDRANSLSTANELGVGRGNGTWTPTDCAHYNAGTFCSAGFS